MDTLTNIRTFLTAARLGSFASAARTLGVAPSVVSKRVNQLEHQFRIRLFFRSTRDLRLTIDGNRMLPQCEQLLTQYEELSDIQPQKKIGGYLRVDAPGTVTSRIFGPLFTEFLSEHPEIEMELRLIDRLSDVVDQDCDITIGTRPSRSSQVVDFPLMPYSNATYASVEYLREAGEPEHPTDLLGHRCLVSLLYGSTWHFYSETGDIAITVRPRFQVNDAIVLREAVRRGLGVGVLPTILVQEDLAAGRLKRLLPRYRPPPLWLKALVPHEKLLKPNVKALLDFMQEHIPNRNESMAADWDNAARIFVEP